MSKPVALVSLALSAAVGVALLSAAPQRLDAPMPEARAIIDGALARATWNAEQNFEGRFRRTMNDRLRKYDDDGEITEDVTRSYLVEPHQGVPYAKLVTKDGEPISGDDLADEEKRWDAFLEELSNPPDPEEADEDPLELAFNEELIARYTTEAAGLRTLRGRPTYVLAFTPRPGKLPVRRRLDRVLNKSRGEIWIDQDTFEVARLTFELTERVRLWWGILGSVSNVTGRVERRPIAEDVWMPDEVDVYYEYRVLFSNSGRGGTTRWSDFTAIGE
jgi:hypothetical protein